MVRDACFVLSLKDDAPVVEDVKDDHEEDDDEDDDEDDEDDKDDASPGTIFVSVFQYRKVCVSVVFLAMCLLNLLIGFNRFSSFGV